MKIRLPYLMACAAIASLLAVPALAFASEEDKPKRQPTAAQTAQQNKMKACNAEAAKKGLKGDPRRTFMSECLKAS